MKWEMSFWRRTAENQQRAVTRALDLAYHIRVVTRQGKVVEGELSLFEPCTEISLMLDGEVVDIPTQNIREVQPPLKPCASYV
ncbi:MAG: hypothetical protein V1778_01465 [bacterium]